MITNNGKGISFDKTMVNIRGLFDKRVHAAYALCRKYAELSRQSLQDTQGLEQGEHHFWTNRTTLAIRSVIGYTIFDGTVEGVSFDDGSHTEPGYIGWGLAHTMEYGKWLEVAKGRKGKGFGPVFHGRLEENLCLAKRSWQN